MVTDGKADGREFAQCDQNEVSNEVWMCHTGDFTTCKPVEQGVSWPGGQAVRGESALITRPAGEALDRIKVNTLCSVLGSFKCGTIQIKCDCLWCHI